MRILLLVAMAATPLLFAMPIGSASAAPIGGAALLARQSLLTVEPATFFRCGLFFNRCRGDRRRNFRRNFRR